MVIYLDSGDWQVFDKYHPHVAGFTTNPSLMAAGGVRQYTDWAKWVAGTCAGGKPISLEVFADELEEMEEQARILSDISNNVYVKIPITNTKGISTAPLIKKLSEEGIKLNITAILTHDQATVAAGSLCLDTPSIISVFCGRIADTGRNPASFIGTALDRKPLEAKVLWASAREVYNIRQAREAGADIITLSPTLLGKYLEMDGKSLTELSLETVKQFHEDSKRIAF